MIRMLIACLAAFIASGNAIAGSMNGPWLFRLVPADANCGKKESYAVSIIDNKLRPYGASDDKISGVVAQDNTVSFKFSQGRDVLAGTGHLTEGIPMASGRFTETRGEGVWSSKSSKTGCSGTWKARRGLDPPPPEW